MWLFIYKYYKKLHNIIFFHFNVRIIEAVLDSILLIEINVTVTRRIGQVLSNVWFNFRVRCATGKIISHFFFFFYSLNTTSSCLFRSNIERCSESQSAVWKDGGRGREILQLSSILVAAKIRVKWFLNGIMKFTYHVKHIADVHYYV